MLRLRTVSSDMNTLPKGNRKTKARVRTNFASFELLFKPPHAEDLVQNLDPLWGLDLPLAIICDLLQLVGCDAVFAQFTEDMDQETKSLCRDS